MFDITNGCKHPHNMLERQGDSTPFVLPEGKHHTALDVTEGMFQCLNIADPPSKIEITVDDEWNVTSNSQIEDLMITLSSAHELGWIIENNTLTPSVRMNASPQKENMVLIGSSYQLAPPSHIPVFTSFFLRCRSARVSSGWFKFKPISWNRGRWVTSAYLSSIR